MTLTSFPPNPFDWGERGEKSKFMRDFAPLPPLSKNRTETLFSSPPFIKTESELCSPPLPL